MNIVVTGSIAFDYLMSFPGKFTEHFLPEHMSRVSLSFLVDSMDKRRGGCAPNIAYTLALLGETPRLMATAGQDFNGIPVPQGARGWHPSAFSPQTGLLYIPTQEAYFAWVHDPAYLPSDTGYNLGIDLSGGDYYQTHPNAPRGFVSSLQAWDPTTGTRAWAGESNVGPTGGALATAGGLVFQGGGGSQEFRAYDAATGAKLWSTEARTGVFAGPVSYEVDGRQYIAVVVGSGASGPSAPNLSRVLVFALNGTASLPP